MRKIIATICLCGLIFLLPVTTAFSQQPAVPITRLSSNKVSHMDSPPTWAKGNFSGVWGLNILGIPLEPAGWIKGYYQKIGLGQFEGTYASFNETNATSFLKGIMLWIFFLGSAGSIQTGNATWVTGIGIANETNFYWRINAIIGPTFYISCQYYPFTNETTE